jgi:hypothetical protein
MVETIVVEGRCDSMFPSLYIAWDVNKQENKVLETDAIFTSPKLAKRYAAARAKTLLAGWETVIVEYKPAVNADCK